MELLNDFGRVPDPLDGAPQPGARTAKVCEINGETQAPPCNETATGGTTGADHHPEIRTRLDDVDPPRIRLRALDADSSWIRAREEDPCVGEAEGPETSATARPV